jgi:signal transduction histidine kinase
MTSLLDEETLSRLRHDVRTPLMIITGFAQLLAADKPISDAERREFAQRIEDAGAELRDMLDTALAKRV